MKWQTEPLIPITLKIAVSQDADHPTVDLECRGDGLPHLTASSPFPFVFAERDQNDIRWYLEEYLEHDAEPAPALAAVVEERLATVGAALFACVFLSNTAAQKIWSSVADRLSDLRIEIRSDNLLADVLPWESLRERCECAPLVTKVYSFVRTANAAFSSRMTSESADGLRVLMVISRPSGSDDVPFLSVARGVVKQLEDARATGFRLDLLRPATVDALQQTLRNALHEGRPYHLVHFDGHGMVIDNRGVLVFENASGGHELVDGRFLGHVLIQHGVHVLLLNACRSAHTQAPGDGPQASADSARASVQPAAYRSLAMDAIQSGVAAVLAMRYNIYVETAARFLATVYRGLRESNPLAHTVTQGRQHLLTNAIKEVGATPRALQDWIVPVLYEQYPVRFDMPETPSPSVDGEPSAAIPPAEDTFYGRDETILALERLFSFARPVLLHSMAGTGKTTTAVQFARWYRRTGGVEHPPLFSSFASYVSFDRLLTDAVVPAFQEQLTLERILWDTLDESERLRTALRLLSGRRTLWIWDNVEEIGGFPSGAKSAWASDEQDELRRLLQQLSNVGVRVLLTSRREERSWLGDLPARVALPPLRTPESFQLIRGIAARRGKPVANLSDWTELVSFASGNPLTLTILTERALKTRTPSKADLTTLLRDVRAGRRPPGDEADEGRETSLAASLSYGFNDGFTAYERRQLALLALFEGVVDVEVFVLMGDRQVRPALAEVEGINRREASALLDRAAELGLTAKFGTYRYHIHPALPWFLNESFSELYRGTRADAARRAFALALGRYAGVVDDQIRMGNRLFRERVRQDEANLLGAMRLALDMDLADTVVAIVSALMPCYLAAGRRADIRRLFTEVGRVVTDSETDGPLRGRELLWMRLIVYRVASAREARRWPDAIRMHAIWERVARTLCAPVLKTPVARLTPEERSLLSYLSVMLHEGAGIRTALNDPSCVEAFTEDFELSLRINDHTGAAITAYNAGQAHLTVPAIRNLSESERWCRLSLELRDSRDAVGRARCFLLLARVERERANEASARLDPDVMTHAYAALEWCQKGLRLLPPDAVAELTLAHNMAGVLLSNLDQSDEAIRHYRVCLRFEEQLGDVFAAGESRENIGAELFAIGRLDQAREYVSRAIMDFTSLGDAAADQARRATGLLDKIQDKMMSRSG